MAAYNSKDVEDHKIKEEVTVGEVQMPSHNPLKRIRNKQQRATMLIKKLREKRKQRKKERKARQQMGLPKQAPKTIESMREPDETALPLPGEEDEELEADARLDEFSTYFKREYEPKVLITFSDNPLSRTRVFGRELCRCIPNAITRYRNRSGVKKMVDSCKREGFSDLIVINEDQRQPNGLLVVHLPDGPTANFKLSNVKLTTDLKRSHKEISQHKPEVILNNFTTRLGHTIANMLGVLFNPDPEFKGRRVVTFHNQRDYIFFRHHMYQYKSAQKVSLRELGPRFTLRLWWLQHGTFDTKTGEFEWDKTGRRHTLEASRRKFYL